MIIMGVEGIHAMEKMEYDVPFLRIVQQITMLSIFSQIHSYIYMDLIGS